MVSRVMNPAREASRGSRTSSLTLNAASKPQ